MLECLAWLGVLAAPAVAQERPTRVQRVEGPLERVVAIVGNDVILHSRVDRAVHDLIRSLPVDQRGGPEQELDLRRQYLNQWVRRSMIAQSARTLGAYEPEQIEELVEDAVRKRQAEEVERFGSSIRFAEELHKNNITWEEIAAEERQEQLRNFADAQVAFGLQGVNRTHLLFTPQEMRRYYETNIERFVSAARTDLEAVAFDDPDKAAAAAAAWSEASRSAADVETEFGGLLHEIHSGADGGFAGAGPEEPPAERDARAGFLWDAAETQAEGSAEVYQRGSVAWVVKVLRRVPTQRREFLDRSVQREIRLALRRRFDTALKNSAYRRSLQRIHVWAPELGR